jgi:hypothetical protein
VSKFTVFKTKEKPFIMFTHYILLKFKIIMPLKLQSLLLFLPLLYRYQVLAFATDADKRQETEHQKLGSGKRLTVRSSLNT